MKRLSTFLSICLAHLIYRLSFLALRNPKIWVCIGWHTSKERELFADNAKYFFLHVHESHKDIRAVWLARDQALADILNSQGYEAYCISSIKGVFYALRAGYTFIDAYLENRFWKYTGGSKIIQLWHGKGMKKTGYDSAYGTKSRSAFLQPGFFAPLHRLVAASPYTTSLMQTTFGVSKDQILKTGLPRDDILFHSIEGAEIDSHHKLGELIKTLRSQNTARILLYAPTFRPDGSNPLLSLDMQRLEMVLEEKKYHLILSLHPKFARKEHTRSAASKHISYIDSGWDIYPYLKNIDVLITDYSSLYVDFLLLDRPMIFYTYDYEKYRTEMGLHEDYLALTPGQHPSTLDALLSAITEEDEYTDKRASVRQILFSHNDGNSSERIVEAILQD
jgi:CDP-glycerol glycerophosphotransferase (TagB/SpsB family)